MTSLLLAIASLAICPPAGAQGVPADGARAASTAPALAVVVESSGTRVDAALLRRRLAASLDMPVMTIFDAQRRPSMGMLGIAVTHGGRRASIHFIPADGVRYSTLITVRAEGRADPAGLWMVEPCRSVVRTSLDRRAAQLASPDHVDPWITQHAQASPGTPSIDPWAGMPRPAVRVWVTEVFLDEGTIDPWTEALRVYEEEQAARATPPAARRPARPRRPTP